MSEQGFGIICGVVFPNMVGFGLALIGCMLSGRCDTFYRAWVAFSSAAATGMVLTVLWRAFT
jgi:hypothetical protein